MPITKSAKKALRQNVRRKARNVKRKRSYRELIKETDKLLSSSQIEEAQKLLPKLYKALDKAVKTGVLKANTASRKKSRFARLTSPKSDPAKKAEQATV